MLAALLTAQRPPQASPTAPPLDPTVPAAPLSSPEAPPPASSARSVPAVSLEAPGSLRPSTGRSDSPASPIPPCSTPPAAPTVAFAPSSARSSSDLPGAPAPSVSLLAALASSPVATRASSDPSCPPGTSTSPFTSFALAPAPTARTLGSDFAPAGPLRSPLTSFDLAPAPTARTLGSDFVPSLVTAPLLDLAPRALVLVSTPPREGSEPPPPPPPPPTPSGGSGGGGGGGYGRVSPIELGNPASLFFDATAPIFAGEVFDPRANGPRRPARPVTFARFLPFGVSERLATALARAGDFFDPAVSIFGSARAPAAAPPARVRDAREERGSVGVREVAWLAAAVTAFSFGWDRVAYFAAVRTVRPLLERFINP